MYPVHLQEGKRGIGMIYRDFCKAFEAICEEHMRAGNARCFAFVFFDAEGGILRTALSDMHGFSTLNEATGKAMTLFYLHAGAGELIEPFNRHFMRALGVEEQAQPPCIVFFRTANGAVEDVSIHEVDENVGDPVLIVEEMRRSVVDYLEDLGQQGNLGALPSFGEVLSVAKFLGILRQFV